MGFHILQVRTRARRLPYAYLRTSFSLLAILIYKKDKEIHLEDLPYYNEDADDEIIAPELDGNERYDEYEIERISEHAYFDFADASGRLAFEVKFVGYAEGEEDDEAYWYSLMDFYLMAKIMTLQYVFEKCRNDVLLDDFRAKLLREDLQARDYYEDLQQW
jgi:hypothetical protein